MSCNELDLVKIGDICDVGSSKRIYASDYTESGIPFYRSKEVIELATNQEIINELFISKDKFNQLDEKFGSPKNGDILLASIGANMGIPYYVNTNYKFYFKDGNVTWFKNFKNNVNSKYIYYWIKSPLTQQKFINIAIGSAQKALTIDSLRKLDIYLPPLEEQEKIANILSSLDDKIELNNEMNKTLEEMAQSIFKRWFVDFEFPNEDGLPYKSSGGEMVESELGMIPKGWEVTHIYDISQVTMGVSPSSKTYNEDNIGLPLLNGAADFEGKLIKPSKFTSEPKKICKKDDMVFGVRATIGNIVFADKEYALGRGVASVEPNNKVFREFIYYSLDNSMENLINNASGSVFLNLKKADITDLKVCYSEEIVEKFNNVAKVLIDKVIENDIESEMLKQNRDILLSKLMNGEIQI